MSDKLLMEEAHRWASQYCVDNQLNYTNEGLLFEAVKDVRLKWLKEKTEHTASSTISEGQREEETDWRIKHLQELLAHKTAVGEAMDRRIAELESQLPEGTAKGNFVKIDDGIFPHPAQLMKMMDGLHDRIEELEKQLSSQEAKAIALLRKVYAWDTYYFDVIHDTKARSEFIETISDIRQYLSQFSSPSSPVKE